MPILEAEARLTVQNQITIPAVIRKALQLSGGQSRIKFQVREGAVLVTRVDDEEDAALKPFLDLLAQDLRERPERVRPVPRELVKRIASAVRGVEVDLQGPLTGEE